MSKFAVWVWCGWMLALLVGPASGQPTAQLSDSQQQELRDLRNLIEGPNSRSVRQTGARQLLQLEWVPDATVVNLLSNPQPDAQRAIAAALAEQPDRWRAALVAPLAELLHSPDETLHGVAGDALANGPSALTLPVLRTQVENRDGHAPTRRRVLPILIRIPDRQALGILVGLVGRETDPIRADAWRTLRQTEDPTLPDSPEGLPAWWQQLQQIPESDWQRRQLQRMQFGQQRLQRRVRELENRLSATLRDAYLRLPEAQQEATLIGHLGDPAVVVRLLGLDLVQGILSEGREPSGAVAETTRGLLRDSDPIVRAVAAQTVAAQRKPEDEQAFLAILDQERDNDVLRALINGLGYVGTARAVERLLSFVTVSELRTADEAVGSLGRLAERGVLQEAERTAVADALLQRFKVVQNQNGHEARVLWAMGRVGDERFCSILIEVSRSSDAPATRLAGLRAMASLVRREPPLPQQAELLQAIAVCSSDQDDAMRRVAIETLVPVATVTELDALCARLDPATEADDDLRRSAWEGVQRLLPQLDRSAISKLVEGLQPPTLTDAQRIALLQAALQNLPEDAPPQDRGPLQAELARRLFNTGQMTQALPIARGALQQQHAAGAKDLMPVAELVLNLSLQSNTYDATIAAELNAVNPLLDLDALWKARCERMRDLLKPPSVATAAAMLQTLEAHPPEKLGEEARALVRDLKQEAEALIRAETERTVRDSLVRLRENPQDESAVEAIVALGGEAIPELRATLKTILASEPLDREAEQRVYELLKRVHPDWPGYAPDATLEDKQAALG